MSTLQAIRLRCTECGDCWLWDGALCGGYNGSHRTPSMHFRGKTASVRRVVYELRHGGIPEGKVISPRCGQRLCVSPECLQALTVKQSKERAAKRGAFSNPGKNRRGAMTKRARSWITDEMVAQIRTANVASRKIAADTGVSLSHVKAIRRGQARRDYANPLGGLMA